MMRTEEEASDRLLGSYSRKIENDPSLVIAGYQERPHL
jgi:hypothetical protein